MKTIFIPLFSGIEGKNILRTGIYARLAKEENLRTVFFVKDEKRAAYYRAEFGSPRVFFECVPKMKTGSADAFFSFLKFYLLRSHTIDLKRNTNLERTYNYFNFILSFLANKALAWPMVRKAVRFFDAHVVGTHLSLKKFFDAYKPDLVFLADLFDNTEAAFLREARRRRIKTVGFLSTWDRVTSRWMIRLLPDELIVFNEELKKESAEYADMPQGKIFVSGAVQLDNHLNHSPAPREEVARRLSISPKQRYIVYGPLGRSFDKTAESDQEMVALLNSFIENKQCGFAGTEKVVVRFPPNDFIDTEKLKQLPHIVYDIPGTRFGTVRGQDWDMNGGELDYLTDLLFHSSLVITYYSSLSIDAAVLDKPVINVNFYPTDERKRHPYYETTHYSKVKSLGGIALVQSKEELCRASGAYLANPSLHARERRAIAQQQGFRIDGKSGERVAEKILELLY
ncbi:MAG: CDP-glycerol glycerophosphotransferase family protein [bacterium]|nr:CDP-glycerol glycerophosphotransferase family protein [bacterium]